LAVSTIATASTTAGKLKIGSRARVTESSFDRVRPGPRLA
jgi:hypothetical protein